MAEKSWKHDPTIPRFVLAAVRKGLKIADSIGVEEGNDKTWLTIKFTKLPPSVNAVDPSAQPSGTPTPPVKKSS